MRSRKPKGYGPAARKSERPYVDMNRPGSPEYAARHRTTSREIMPGMTRIDIGTAS
ncbi:hypothetical protein TMRH483_02010 [Qipengyuania sp. 483]